MDPAIWLLGMTTVVSGAFGLAGFLSSRVPQKPALASAVCFVAVGVLWIIVTGISRRDAFYAEYLEDCMAHRAKYECVLLWRASSGNSKGNDPIIIPAPIPMR